MLRNPSATSVRLERAQGDRLLPPQEQLEILRRGVEEIIPLDELEAKLQRSYASASL